MKVADIVKPSDLGDFLRLQVSCLTDEMQKLCFLARFDHVQHHLPGKPVVELIACYEVAQMPAVEISFLVSDCAEDVIRCFEQMMGGPQIAQQLGLAWVELKQGIRLEPVHIPKPWGQEIWYTGIEQRGVSRVCSGDVSHPGKSPLDWVLAAAPGYVLGEHAAPILLKILDPLPDEVYGDLYFEMHEQKQEVYVVTHVDGRAWPEGQGGIRFGFNQSLRQQFASDEQFRQAYLKAVQDYRGVRQQIDALLDARRAEEHIPANDPVMPDKIKTWLGDVPASLLAQEKKMRDAMENFVAIKSLRVGDVVKVPIRTPHSLQHGVRTVEFQTPVYERKILSFAQKVLTQNHWDTEEAIARLLLEAPADDELEVIEESRGLRRERVVRFDDFEVERITLMPGSRWHMTPAVYALVMSVRGGAMVNDQRLQAEQALLVSQGMPVRLESEKEEVVVLLAQPA